jgi:plastocyanin
VAIEGTVSGIRSAHSEAKPAVVSGTRSTAMWLMPTAAFVEAVVMVLVMSSIGFIPPLMVFLALLLVTGVLGFARPQQRVFVAGGVLLLAFVGMNLPFAVDGLVHPIGSSHAWSDIIAVVVGIAGAIAGFAAFVELRRGQPLVPALKAPIGEALAILVVGALIGTTYVSISGFSALEASPGLGVANGVQKAPTQTPAVLDVPGTTFTQTALQLSAGAGTVYVVNTDKNPHTFDMDLNGRHLSYALPADSTTAVVLNLTTPGNYTYWCAIPGHRSAMEGTLKVIE